jgi:hypothetical protein
MIPSRPWAAAVSASEPPARPPARFGAFGSDPLAGEKIDTPAGISTHKDDRPVAPAGTLSHAARPELTNPVSIFAWHSCSFARGRKPTRTFFGRSVADLHTYSDVPRAAIGAAATVWAAASWVLSAFRMAGSTRLTPTISAGSATFHVGEPGGGG